MAKSSVIELAECNVGLHFSAGLRVVLVTDKRDGEHYVYRQLSDVARAAGVVPGTLRNLLVGGVVEDFRGFRIERVKEWGGADMKRDRVLDVVVEATDMVGLMVEAEMLEKPVRFGKVRKNGKDVFGAALSMTGVVEKDGVLDPDALF